MRQLFRLHERLRGCEVVAYRCDVDELWHAVTGLYPINFPEVPNLFIHTLFFIYSIVTLCTITIFAYKIKIINTRVIMLQSENLFAID